MICITTLVVLKARFIPADVLDSTCLIGLRGEVDIILADQIFHLFD